jgi:hypothetical protein
VNRICQQCRRIQEDARQCVECAGVQLSLWPDGIEWLRKEEIHGLRLGHDERGWGCFGMLFTFVAMLVAGGLGVGLLIAITHREDLGLLGFFLGFFGTALTFNRVQYLRVRVRRERRLMGRSTDSLALPPGRERREGVARAFQKSGPSLLSGKTCLASEVVGRRGHGTIFKRVAANDFWLDCAEGEIFVCGVLELRGEPSARIGAGSSAGRAAVKLDRIALPDLDEVQLEELRLAPGSEISVEGAIGDEVIADLGYRGERVKVMRGVPGSPLVIQLSQRVT